MRPPARYVILGTAGHIDHGKTSLVRRLTGIETDRLPEEKARGMSIDLGFAHFDQAEFRFALIDVPGHERFVKNMVAGATGLDMALLVVAADDGVMPQTREHLQIMQLLGISIGLVAISKCDLARPERVAQVADEVRECARGTFLQAAPIVPVSSVTSAGLPALCANLVELARRAPTRPASELFRMPIDRAFTRDGFGAVVTGSVLSGAIGAGQMVEILPDQRLARVRGVQCHGRSIDQGSAGQRAAVNLAGLSADQLWRGQELASPGFLRPATLFLARIDCLPDARLALAGKTELQLHLGTNQVKARLIGPRGGIAPGTRGYAQLTLARPAVACAGQRFILRLPSMAATVAGGVILDPGLERRLKSSEANDLAAALDGADESKRLSRVLLHCPAIERDGRFAAWKAGIQPSQYAGVLEELVRRGVVVHWAGRLIHAERVERLLRAALGEIERAISRQGVVRGAPERLVRAACSRAVEGALVEPVIQRLRERKQLVEVAGNLAVAGSKARLGKARGALRDALQEAIERSGLCPPDARELAHRMEQKPELVRMLLQSCAEEGTLHAIADGLFLSTAALEQARKICAGLFDRTGRATLSELREAWGVSRKHAFPLCEHFDRLQITRREGRVHVPGPQLRTSLRGTET
jgi:selenocysteine-specific elongation factor